VEETVHFGVGQFVVVVNIESVVNVSNLRPLAFAQRLIFFARVAVHHHFFVGGHGLLLARGALGASLAAGTLFVEGLADRTHVEGLDLPGRLQKLVEVFGVDSLEGNASANKLAVVHHIILVFVGLKKRFGDGVVQFDVVGSVKVGSDGVEQLLELGLGQRLGGVVRVQGSEKIVDLRPLAVRQRNAVRFSGVNGGANVPGCIFGATARLALVTGIPRAHVCAAIFFVGFFVESFVHSEEGDVIHFSMAQ
jgi:hypothetical protein